MANLLSHARRRAFSINRSQTLAFLRSFSSPSPSQTLASSFRRPWTLEDTRFVNGVPSFKVTSLFGAYKKFCTYHEARESEGVIPSELLTSKNATAPNRTIGEYADLVMRVTNFQNEDKGLIVLAGDVFDVPIKKDTIHQVVRWQLAKRQQGTHSTKTISEVSGTGKKPYNQKGTGRARHGTLRGPQFRGGAVMREPKQCYLKRWALLGVGPSAQRLNA
ncbi:uncharacterized protein LOC109819912 [Asparagus officinalis]|uniref:uncharacterized protein LOC109819912 n=1 Tax=Asparagus officinalis TaxID=4686 RepID=UPI00098E0548|nr:uncharacterized protein LOC109819912 [Asparagus officinalis]